MSSLHYRPDVDGLRTIAVVPVVLFHAGLSLFSGGYVGVDVFFVISGYLITGILLKDIERNRFSIATFYKRRIRRIFPALIVVLLATSVVAALVFPPQQFQAYGSSLGFVSIFLSNFWFMRAVDYFETAAHIETLLHTWSLAVEEQFYIFYPILLYLVARLRGKIGPILLGIGAVSLVLAVALLPRMPGAVFYLLPTRAWELIIGGLLACGFVPAPRTDRWAHVGGAIGLAMILGAVALYKHDTPFPGLAAVPPCVGAALLIWAGTRPSGPSYRLLASRPFVLVGQASYSYYLWHFPMFAFAAYLYGGKLPLAAGLVLSVAALALALVTLVLVENPVRRSRNPATIILPLLAMAALGAAGFAVAASNGFPERFDARSRAYLATMDDKARHHEECMTVTAIFEPSRPCVLGADVEPTVLLWGDSHAMVTATAMEIAARRAGKSFAFAADADCPPGLGFGIDRGHEPGLTSQASYRYCETYNREMLKLAKARAVIETVVISSRWTNWRIGAPPNDAETPVDLRLAAGGRVATDLAGNEAIWRAGFLRLIEELRASGKKVVLVGPLPEPAYNVPLRFFVARFGLADAPQPIAESAFRRRHAKILALIEQLAEAGKVTAIWPHERLCNRGSCPLKRDGHLVYFDHNHLSIYGAALTAPTYRSIFE